VAELGRDVFGKGIVFAKNTPNFIGNRIGAYGMMYTVNRMLEDGLTIAQVDAILGQPLGRPKTAVFKTADMVGIDTLAHVAKNIYPAIPDDPQRDAYRVPGFIEKMIEAGRLGNKTRGGFYSKNGGDRFVLDHTTGEYEPLERPSFASVDAAKSIEDTAQRIKKIMTEGADEGAAFAWNVTAATLVYSAGMIPEISDNLVEIDRGMCWGYNWELGPFETWDAIGVAESAERMEKDGFGVPACVKKMLASGANTFYEQRDDGLYYYDLVGGGYKQVDRDPKRIWIPDIKRSHVVGRRRRCAARRIPDQDEFCRRQCRDDARHGRREGRDRRLEGSCNRQPRQCVQCGRQPVSRLRARAEEELGRVERDDYGVPGCQHAPQVFERSGRGGGRWHGAGRWLRDPDALRPRRSGGFQAGIPRGVVVPPLNLVQKSFENIATAKVSTSGKEAIENGHLLPWQTRVVLNRNQIIQYAKQEVLGLHVAGYEPPERRKIKLAGGSAFAALVLGVDGFHRSGFATEYDVAIGQKLAKVLTGGDIPENTQVDEQYVLDLEREAFLSLCGEEKTQARIETMLKTNRPLRN